MKTLNIYFDCEFSSLSPDAQLISIGMVTDEIQGGVRLVRKDLMLEGESEHVFSKRAIEQNLGEEILSPPIAKSFYAEFTDFDINRCDDWVKENVVGKLMINSWAKQLNITFEEAKNAAKTSTNWSKEYCIAKSNETEISLVGNMWRIKEELRQWLSQFSDYQIQFVADCSTWDWYHLLQLLAEWKEVRTNETYDRKSDGKVCDCYRMVGLPKLPSNISPVPFDLNDLIAIRKGITPAEAFDLNREELAGIWAIYGEYQQLSTGNSSQSDHKHNAIWDAKVIRAIYNKLINQ